MLVRSDALLLAHAGAQDDDMANQWREQLRQSIDMLVTFREDQGRTSRSNSVYDVLTDAACASIVLGQ